MSTRAATQPWPKRAPVQSDAWQLSRPSPTAHRECFGSVLDSPLRVRMRACGRRRRRCRAGRLTAVAVTLGEITDSNRDAVLSLRVAPEQERFVGSVRGALADAAEYPHARPWYRVVLAAEKPVGFVMLSWNVEPQPPEIIGPWFLWKLLIDERYQGRGYGLEVVRQVAELVRA
jgi:GNAT superfamily N-acetyltransferase